MPVMNSHRRTSRQHAPMTSAIFISQNMSYGKNVLLTSFGQKRKGWRWKDEHCANDMTDYLGSKMSIFLINFQNTSRNYILDTRLILRSCG